jgi:hypothetical protein
MNLNIDYGNINNIEVVAEDLTDSENQSSQNQSQFLQN